MAFNSLCVGICTLSLFCVCVCVVAEHDHFVVRVPTCISAESPLYEMPSSSLQLWQSLCLYGVHLQCLLSCWCFSVTPCACMFQTPKAGGMYGSYFAQQISNGAAHSSCPQQCYSCCCHISLPCLLCHAFVG